MRRPRTDAERLASEIVNLPIPRAELIWRIANLIEQHDREEVEWLRRLDQAEWELEDARRYAKACEASAAEWKQKAEEGIKATRPLVQATCAAIADHYGKSWCVKRSLEGTYKARAAADIATRIRHLYEPLEAQQEGQAS